MKTLRLFSMLLIALSINFCFIACSSDDEDDELIYTEDTSSNNDNNDNDDSSSSTTSISSLVSKYVGGSAQYSDYAWIINISTTLSDELPNKTIKYGLECGYGAYSYQKYFTIDGMFFTTTFGIFVDISEYGAYSVYYGSYVILKEKMEAGITLTSDEKDLYYGVIDAMNEAIKGGANKFQGRLFVEIDGKRYYFLTFKYK